MKTAFLTFFPVFPTNMGSAEVIRSMFLCWPGNKKIFQISHLNFKKKKNLETIKIFKEQPILKLLMIPIAIIKILKYLKKEKTKIVIIEGPSWIGYSIISLLLLKLFSPSIKIIYHSHSIEYEVRKMMSNVVITKISKVLEKYVFKFADLATSVSDIEKNKIESLYNVKCVIFENGISEKILKFKKKKILNYNYLIYTGSYKYLPNKLAIDYIVDFLMPKIIKKYPQLKLVLTGGGFEKKRKFILNLGIVTKSKLLNLIYNSEMMIVPLTNGTGTRIKIIEGLLIGANILSTNKGIEGINIKNNNYKFPIIVKKNKFYEMIDKLVYRNNRKEINKDYLNKYSMENIVKKFFNTKDVKKIFKTD